MYVLNKGFVSHHDDLGSDGERLLFQYPDHKYEWDINSLESFVWICDHLIHIQIEASDYSHSHGTWLLNWYKNRQ